MNMTMQALLSFYRSSIGKKWIVAITGLILILYVIGHLLGNLQIYAGPELINAYAQKLRNWGLFLWLVRFFLLAAFVLHIVATIQLAIENRAARAHRYAEYRYVQASPGARTMVISGLIVLVFIVYHILHFTAQVTHPAFRQLYDAQGRHDVYSMMILGFQNPYVSFFYLLGVFLLCLHLSHGFQSFLQTFGIRTGKLQSSISTGGQVLAWLIFAGYASIPLAVLFGFLRLPARL